MITKGYIVDKSKISDNKFLVKLPVFDNAGIAMSSLNNTVFEATVCYAPGNYNGLKPGDCVFVGFENDNHDGPMILGKLFTGDINPESFSNVSSLNVSLKATLPADTTIGSLNVYKLAKNMKFTEHLNDKVKTLEDANLINYSTNEQYVGTWVDGKNLYRKIIQYTGSPEINVKTTVGSLNCNVGQIVKIERVIHIRQPLSSEEYYCDNYVVSTDSQQTMTVEVVKSTGDVRIFPINTTMNNISILITVYFTKA